MRINLPWLRQKCSICSAVWEALSPIRSLCWYKTSQCFSAIFMAYITVLVRNALKNSTQSCRATWSTLYLWPLLLWESFHEVRHPDECWSVSVVTSAKQSHQTLSSCLCLPVLTVWLFTDRRRDQIIYLTPLRRGSSLMLNRNHFIPIFNNHVFVCFQVCVIGYKTCLVYIW